MVDGDSQRHMEKEKKYELKMEELKRGYTRLMEEDDGFEDDRIWNMDETAVLLDPVFNKVEIRGREREWRYYGTKISTTCCFLGY